MAIRSAFLCLFVAFFMSGCVETLPMSTRQPQMTFDNLKKVEVDVSAIEVINNYKPPMRDPNVEHIFQTPLYTAAENLVKMQLVASGSSNLLRVFIDDASVVRDQLPITKGMRNVFIREPAERFKAKVLLRFELVNPQAPDIILGHAEVIAKRTKTLLEDASLADRDNAYFTLTKDLMDDLNNGLMTVVKDTFGKR